MTQSLYITAKKVDPFQQLI